MALCAFDPFNLDPLIPLSSGVQVRVLLSASFFTIDLLSAYSSFIWVPHPSISYAWYPRLLTVVGFSRRPTCDEKSRRSTFLLQQRLADPRRQCESYNTSHRYRRNW